MKKKAIEAASFLSNVRQNCRIMNRDNIPLTGQEYDAIREALEVLSGFVHAAEIPAKPDDEKLVKPSRNPQ